MTEPTTYIDPSYKLASGAPKTIDGITFRPYRTGISRFARISDDGQIMVQHDSRYTGYNVYVIGHGAIKGRNNKTTNFHDESRAYAAAITLFRKLRIRDLVTPRIRDEPTHLQIVGRQPRPGKFDNVYLGTDKTMQRMLKAEQDKRRAAMRLAAEFAFKAAERGDNMEQMMRDLETLIAGE